MQCQQNLILHINDNFLDSLNCANKSHLSAQVSIEEITLIKLCLTLILEDVKY